MVGAEGVCENGGVVNQIGSYQIAVVAKASNTPFYVVTESHKVCMHPLTHQFLKLFPLNQYDICTPSRINVGGGCKEMKRTRSMQSSGVDGQVVDYTPPQYISLLFTDMGVLTASAASDELLRYFS